MYVICILIYLLTGQLYNTRSYWLSGRVWRFWFPRCYLHIWCKLDCSSSILHWHPVSDSISIWTLSSTCHYLVGSEPLAHVFIHTTQLRMPRLAWESCRCWRWVNSHGTLYQISLPEQHNEMWSVLRVLSDAPMLLVEMHPSWVPHGSCKHWVCLSSNQQKTINYPRCDDQYFQVCSSLLLRPCICI